MFCFITGDSDDGDTQPTGSRQAHSAEDDRDTDSDDDDDGSDYDDDDEEESDDGGGDDDDVIYFSEVFEVVGSCHEKRYQDALAEVQHSMSSNDTVPVRAEYDSTNSQDFNAIKVEGYLGDEWQILGYVKKQKIPKLTSAMRQGELTDCRFAKRPAYKLNAYNSGKNGLTCELIITKRFRWDRNDKHYSYNQDLSHL